jgi:hypothetical protein
MLGKAMDINANWTATLLPWQPGDACVVIEIAELARLGTSQVCHQTVCRVQSTQHVQTVTV